MFTIITKSALIILAGVYAMRASGFLFDGKIGPLTPVAVLAFILAVAAFQRPPEAHGFWLYAVLAGSVLGLIANTLLLLRPDAAHGTVTNMTFSAVSICGWTILAISCGMVLLRGR